MAKLSYNELIERYWKALTDNRADSNKTFAHINENGDVVNLTDGFQSGSLRPLVYWLADNYRFEMIEGRQRLYPSDWVKHNTGVGFKVDTSIPLTGVNIYRIDADTLKVSLDEFLLLTTHAYDELHRTSPKMSIGANAALLGFNKNIENCVDISPVINRFSNWVAMYEKVGSALIGKPELTLNPLVGSDIFAETTSNALSDFGLGTKETPVFINPYVEKLKQRIEELTQQTQPDPQIAKNVELQHAVNNNSQPMRMGR